MNRVCCGAYENKLKREVRCESVAVPQLYIRSFLQIPLRNREGVKNVDDKPGDLPKLVHTNAHVEMSGEIIVRQTNLNS